jgi:CRISPR-associated protein Csy2
MKPSPFDALLLLPRLRVQNANAVSSPMTWGFPAPNAFTGFAHALQRRLNAMGHAIQLGGVGIVCHQFDPQVFQPPGRRTQVFRLTRNPVDKNGNTSAIVEEGRTHLEVSLLLTVSGDGCPVNAADCEALAAMVLEHAEGMRLAGGSILPQPKRPKHPARWLEWPKLLSDQRLAWRKLRRHLMPGFVLVSRAPLLVQHLQTLQQTQPQANALDALLDVCRLNVEPTAAESDDDSDSDASITWAVRRRYRGWLVPLPLGYAAVSPLYPPGTVKNARDETAPFRFVESLLSLGEWVSPHRIAEAAHLLWHFDAQPEAGLYRLHNPYPFASSSIDSPALNA